jgi:GNAT superfamily N-acetyltransferase
MQAPRGEGNAPGDLLGPLYAWWRGDALPTLAPLPGWAAQQSDDAELIAGLGGLEVGEVRARIGGLHRAYVAYLGDEAVGYGWSATVQASIGALGLTIAVPPANRWLWDFATLPAWRGRGVYPRLLQAIVTREAVGDGAVERFWIGHDAPNTASARGLIKAGFRAVGDFCALPGGRLALVGRGAGERAGVGAALFGVPLL